MRVPIGRPDPVSIHAPARAAATTGRLSALDVPEFERMFQSTPPRGRRLLAVRKPSFDAVVFQSTPPRGRATIEQLQGEQFRGCIDVSIHAPARGRPLSRRGRSYAEASLSSFNPRPRAGRRSDDPSDREAPISRFQSTPPARGATFCLRDAYIATTCFNPRPARGRPTDRIGCHRGNTVSIHAPRGRPIGLGLTSGRGGFNPRPRAGGDCS